MKTLIIILIATIFISCSNKSNIDVNKCENSNNLEDINLGVLDSNFNISSKIKSINYSIYNYDSTRVSVKLRIDLNNSDEYKSIIIYGFAKPEYSRDTNFCFKDIEIISKSKMEDSLISFQRPNVYSTHWIEEVCLAPFKNKSLKLVLEEDLILTDLNFDNKTDFRIKCPIFCGSGGDIYYTWLYDSQKNQFQFDTLLSSYNVSLNEKEKLINLHWRYGYYDQVFKTYSLENGVYTLISTTIWYGEEENGEIIQKEKTTIYKNSEK